MRPGALGEQLGEQDGAEVVGQPRPEGREGGAGHVEVFGTERPADGRGVQVSGEQIGSLFPLLKAAPQHGLDKIFFLAAKTSGRQMALDAVTRLRESAPLLPLRTLELTAKRRACEHPDKACHGEACPLARGFYDRLPAARAAALELPLLDRASVRAAALAHDVCPYYLQSELARWADVIVGDYNYYFDFSALLHSLTVLNEWRVAVLVDENMTVAAGGIQVIQHILLNALRAMRRFKIVSLIQVAWLITTAALCVGFTRLAGVNGVGWALIASFSCGTLLCAALVYFSLRGTSKHVSAGAY